ncbi:MAG: cupin domain-containing protein [Chloroflexi bacterium]|nr:cupin domain-containing protein [Chloroflexota bacterium]
METRFYTWDDLPQTEMMPGVNRRLIAGERLMVVQVTAAQGTVVPQHRHPHEQITLLLSGALRVISGGVAREMRAGEAVHFPSNAPHEVVVLEDSIIHDIFSPPREDFLK